MTNATDKDQPLPNWKPSKPRSARLPGLCAAQRRARAGGRLLQELETHAYQAGAHALLGQHALYQHHPRRPAAALPGSREIERRIKSLSAERHGHGVRANREEAGIGGHISTYASAATLYEVGFNHFFRAPSDTYEAT